MFKTIPIPLFFYSKDLISLVASRFSRWMSCSLVLEENAAAQVVAPLPALGVETQEARHWGVPKLDVGKRAHVGFVLAYLEVLTQYTTEAFLLP